MTDPERPDLSHTSPEIRSYISFLESEITRYEELLADRNRVGKSEEYPYEEPSALNLITATRAGVAKRTPSHLYPRQRRGGMGIYDLDAPDDDPPAMLSIAEENQALLVITSHARAYRLPFSQVPETPVRAKGSSITTRLNLGDDETIAAILPIQAQGYLVLLSRSGMLRSLRHHIFGEYMKPGIPLYDIKSFGLLASATWTPGDGELLIATQQGRAIRFAEKLVPPQGCLGIRLAPEDRAVAVAPVYNDSEVFFLSADGHGTIRQMSGFAANKAPGSGGKNAMATNHLVGAINVDGVDDLFMISRLSKVIRFRQSEVPVKEGVVQGVICMSFRADEVVAVIARRLVLTQ